MSLMGEMVGFMKEAFPIELLDKIPHLGTKGEDQFWMGKNLLRHIRDSITEHRIKGLPSNKVNRFSYSRIHDIDIPADPKHKETNLLVNHIGQGGFHLEKTHNPDINKTYEGAVPYFMREGDQELNEKLKQIESKFDIFYWNEKDNS